MSERASLYAFLLDVQTRRGESVTQTQSKDVFNLFEEKPARARSRRVPRNVDTNDRTITCKKGVLRLCSSCKCEKGLESFLGNNKSCEKCLLRRRRSKIFKTILWPRRILSRRDAPTCAEKEDNRRIMNQEHQTFFASRSLVHGHLHRLRHAPRRAAVLISTRCQRECK